MSSASRVNTSTIVSARNRVPSTSWSATKSIDHAWLGPLRDVLLAASHDHLSPPGPFAAQLQALLGVEPVRSGPCRVTNLPVAAERAGAGSRNGSALAPVPAFGPAAPSLGPIIAGKNAAQSSPLLLPSKYSAGLLLTQRAVRSMLVVVDPPRFDLAPGIVDRQELVGVQTFIAQLAVERLDEARFPTGFPGRMKSSLTPRRYAHSSSAREVNSVP